MDKTTAVLYLVRDMIDAPFARNHPMIACSILSADFAKLGSEIDEVLRGGGDFLHLDVLDGHFAPNISFGPAVTAAARRCTGAYLDVHLMIDEPLRYAPAFAKAGANNITFHVEAVDDPIATAREIRKLGCNVGITLRPSTPLETILPAMNEVDLVLVMSVEPGFSGQKFMPEMLPRCREVKQRLRPEQRLEIDGGMNIDTIASALAAGVNWFVVASAIFDQLDRAKAIAELRKKLEL